jgi:hypothetical protein
LNILNSIDSDVFISSIKMSKLFNIKIDGNEIDTLYADMTIFERIYSNLKEIERNISPNKIYDVSQLYHSEKDNRSSKEDQCRILELKSKIKNLKETYDEFSIYFQDLVCHIQSIHYFYKKYQYRGLSWDFIILWKAHSKELSNCRHDKMSEKNFSIDSLSILAQIISNSLNDLDKYYFNNNIHVKPASRICNNTDELIVKQTYLIDL